MRVGPVLTHPVEIGLPGHELLDVRVGPVGVDAVHHLLLHLQSLQEGLAVGPLLYQLCYRRVWRGAGAGVTQQALSLGSPRQDRVIKASFPYHRLRLDGTQSTPVKHPYTGQ